MTELDEINKILNDTRKLYEKGLTTLNEGNRLLHDGIYKHPNDISLKLALAAQLASTGGYYDSIGLYQSILQINPNEPYALTGLGHIYFELGRFAESFKLAKTSFSVRDMPETKMLLCRHYLAQGNLDEVKKIITEILKKNPNDAQANLLKQRLEHIKAGDGQPDYQT